MTFDAVEPISKDRFIHETQYYNPDLSDLSLKTVDILELSEEAKNSYIGSVSHLMLNPQKKMIGHESNEYKKRAKFNLFQKNILNAINITQQHNKFLTQDGAGYNFRYKVFKKKPRKVPHRLHKINKKIKKPSLKTEGWFE